ncbi:MAG: hypothetical protein LKM38_16030 [Pseudomonas veronii]|jgi:hypothetical protein|nr:hypothetical protein [Pseudomonas veronii]
MNEEDFEMIEPGVLKYKKNEKGPSETIYQGTKYFRFMDYFYTHTEHLDELKPVEVSNLCRARAQFPELISRANGEVRSLFESLAIKIAPLQPSRNRSRQKSRVHSQYCAGNALRLIGRR